MGRESLEDHLRFATPVEGVTVRICGTRSGSPKGNTHGIGVGTAGYPVAPPSEPYVRFSRIRLSGRWFTAGRIDRPRHGLR